MDTPTITPAQATPDAAANNTGAVDGTQPDGTPPQAATTPAPVQVTLTQEALDKLITARLAQDRKARDAEAQKRAQEEAGNFKALYEALQAEHGQATTQAQERITALEAQVQTLSSAVNAQIDTAIKGWPEVITLTDPGPDAVEARQAWFAKVGPKVNTLTSATPAPPPGPHAPPPAAPNGAAGPSTRQAQISGTW